MKELREPRGVHTRRCAWEWWRRTGREGRRACGWWWDGMRDATDAGEGAGCAVWVCGCETGKVETWR